MILVFLKILPYIWTIFVRFNLVCNSLSTILIDFFVFLYFAASQPSSLSSTSEAATPSQDGFVVQRGRGVPTLTAVVDKSDKEQFNKDTKSEELGESESEQDVFQQMKKIPVAGRPSEASNTVSRRASKTFSRRNSVDDNASQLSLENLGGSQDNLSLLGRNPDKEMRTHVGRREAPHEAINNDHRYAVL